MSVLVGKLVLVFRLGFGVDIPPEWRATPTPPHAYEYPVGEPVTPLVAGAFRKGLFDR